MQATSLDDTVLMQRDEMLSEKPPSRHQQLQDATFKLLDGTSLEKYLSTHASRLPNGEKRKVVILDEKATVASTLKVSTSLLNNFFVHNFLLRFDGASQQVMPTESSSLCGLAAALAAGLSASAGPVCHFSALQELAERNILSAPLIDSTNFDYLGFVSAVDVVNLIIRSARARR